MPRAGRTGPQPLKPAQIGQGLAIQMALQKRLRGLDSMIPSGSMLPGATRFPPGRYPPVVALPPVGGMRSPRKGIQLPGQVPSYQPLGRY